MVFDGFITKTWTATEADELTVAMESLEKFVLSATENALKKSMAPPGRPYALGLS